MRRTLSRQTLHAAVTGFGTAVLIMVSTPVAGSAPARWDAETSSTVFIPEIFDGAGYGSTAESAVQQAIGDANTTASAYQLYSSERSGRM
jgi:hypothetical protein